MRGRITLLLLFPPFVLPVVSFDSTLLFEPRELNWWDEEAFESKDELLTVASVFVLKDNFFTNGCESGEEAKWWSSGEEAIVVGRQTLAMPDLITTNLELGSPQAQIGVPSAKVSTENNSTMVSFCCMHLLYIYQEGWGRGSGRKVTKTT
jgi:hypothetical protein